MTIKIPFFILLASSCFTVKSQINSDSQIDSSLAKKITVSGFCLCQTTVTKLRNLSGDFKEVDVEEMDLGKKCLSQDSRYVNGKGYSSEKYPGLIFQKDQDADYISKIRITKGFKGSLPDGTSVDLNRLLLKDVMKIYPAMNSKWGSRDCSDYWSFSNDTLAFYVKIDKSKKPQFPIDEGYYLDKPVEGIDVLISCYSIFNKSNDVVLFPANEPMFFLDSIRVNKGVLNDYTPDEIAQITVYKDTNAIKIAGKEAKNGAVYIMTKSFARESYWNYFRSKSKEYKMLVPDTDTEVKVVYILNGKILKSNFESDLVKIDDNNLSELSIVDKDKLKKDYKITDKILGVIIKTKK